MPAQVLGLSENYRVRHNINEVLRPINGEGIHFTMDKLLRGCDIPRFDEGFRLHECQKMLADDGVHHFQGLQFRVNCPHWFVQFVDGRDELTGTVSRHNFSYDRAFQAKSYALILPRN